MVLSVIILMLVVAPWRGGDASSFNGCPQHLTRDEYLKVHDNVCYYFDFKDREENVPSEEICEKQGGNLVSIKSQSVQDFIVAELKNSFNYNEGTVWIGLRYNSLLSAFVWRDGSKLEYENFKYGLEDMYVQGNCVALSLPEGKWYAIKCSTFAGIFNRRFPLVCEYPVVIETAVSSTSSPLMATPATNVMATPRETGEICPQHLTRDEYFKVHDNVCYYFDFKDREENVPSEEICEKQGGHLVSIKSQNVQDFIVAELKNSFNYNEGNVWIGLRYNSLLAAFVWRDGSKLEYENFKYGLEDMYVQGNCVALSLPEGKWYAIKCSTFAGIFNRRFPLVCEYPVVIETAVSSTSISTTLMTTSTTANLTPYHETRKPLSTTKTTPNNPTTTTATPLTTPTSTTANLTPYPETRKSLSTTKTTPNNPTTTTATPLTTPTSTTANLTPYPETRKPLSITKTTPNNPPTTTATPLTTPTSTTANLTPYPETRKPLATTKTTPNESTTTMTTIRPHTTISPLTTSTSTRILPKVTTPARPTHCPLCNTDCGTHGFEMKMVNGCLVCSCSDD